MVSLISGNPHIKELPLGGTSGLRLRSGIKVLALAWVFRV